MSCFVVYSSSRNIHYFKKNKKCSSRALFHKCCRLFYWNPKPQNRLFFRALKKTVILNEWVHDIVWQAYTESACPRNVFTTPTPSPFPRHFFKIGTLFVGIFVCVCAHLTFPRTAVCWSTFSWCYLTTLVIALAYIVIRFLPVRPHLVRSTRTDGHLGLFERKTKCQIDGSCTTE